MPGIGEGLEPSQHDDAADMDEHAAGAGILRLPEQHVAGAKLAPLLRPRPDEGGPPLGR